MELILCKSIEKTKYPEEDWTYGLRKEKTE